MQRDICRAPLQLTVGEPIGTTGLAVTGFSRAGHMGQYHILAMGATSSTVIAWESIRSIGRDPPLQSERRRVLRQARLKGRRQLLLHRIHVRAVRASLEMRTYLALSRHGEAPLLIATRSHPNVIAVRRCLTVRSLSASV